MKIWGEFMAKEQLAVIEMIANMILGKTEGVSKVEYTPQKVMCPEVKEDELPRRTPESQGIHSEHLRKLVQELADSPDTDMHHLMVLRHGNVICEVDFAPYRKGIWHITHSMCKSITGMAIGFLIEEGKLELSENIYQIFPDKGSLWTKMFHPEITVENLLNMTSGVTFNESGIISGNDWLESYLNASVAEKPGSQFQYNSLNSYVFSAIVTERTGMPMDEYLEPRLFEPLGITNYFWEKCPKGITKGGWGLFMTAEDMAKLGQLYLNKGKWNGIQIIPEEWVDTSITKKVESIEGTYGYGYQLWMEERPGSFEYNGMLGQNVLVFPDVDMVIVTNAGNEELFQSGKMLDIIRKCFPVEWKPEEILPENPAAYKALQHMIQRLSCEEQTRCEKTGNCGIRSGIRRGGWKQTFMKPSRTQTANPVMRRITRSRSQEQHSKIYKIQKKLDGTCYEMEQTNIGLFPLVMQVMHNNMTDGIRKIGFHVDWETSELLIDFLEGEEWKKLRLGWNRYIENQLTIHEEMYLVAAKGELSFDADHHPVLIVEMAYLEEAMRRKVYITFDENKIETRWFESPGKTLIMEGMESITTEVTKSSIYTRIRENGGVNLLHRLIEQTIEPVAKGKLIN